MSKKVFLDTCIWMELCVLSNPQTVHEIHQSQKASQLLSNLKNEEVEIVSLDYQIIELMQVIMKTKLKECNKMLKGNNQQGVGNIKEFRNNPVCKKYLNQALSVCESTFDDIKNMSKIIDKYSPDIKNVIDSISKMDVNDCIYYEYCKQNNIEFYTFDNDFSDLHQQIVKVI